MRISATAAKQSWYTKRVKNHITEAKAAQFASTGAAYGGLKRVHCPAPGEQCKYDRRFPGKLNRHNQLTSHRSLSSQQLWFLFIYLLFFFQNVDLNQWGRNWKFTASPGSCSAFTRDSFKFITLTNSASKELKCKVSKALLTISVSMMQLIYLLWEWSAFKFDCMTTAHGNCSCLCKRSEILHFTRLGLMFWSCAATWVVWTTRNLYLNYTVCPTYWKIQTTLAHLAFLTRDQGITAYPELEGIHKGPQLQLLWKWRWKTRTGFLTLFYLEVHRVATDNLPTQPVFS